MLVNNTNFMGSVSIHEAKSKLSGLVAAVEKEGEEILLCRYNKPVARIVPCRVRKRTSTSRRLKKIKYQGDLTSPTMEEWADV